MIISEDTVWRTGSEIVLNGDVQVAPGITLTIEPNVIVRGGSIQVFGTLIAIGTDQCNINFNDVDLFFGSSDQTPGRMDISFAIFQGGSFLAPTGNGSYGSFNVSDSIFDEVTGFYIWYPTEASSFERNTFSNSQGLSIGTRNDFLVQDNAFYNPTRPWNGTTDGAIVVWASYGNPVEVHGNTFSLSNGSIAFEIPLNHPSISIDASGNYFGTNLVQNINSLVLDRLDDLNRSSLVNTDNPLLQPSTEAPEVPLFIQGSAIGDTLLGSRLSDTINGNAGNDILQGGAGNDVLSGGIGNDFIDGGDGLDSAEFDFIFVPENIVFIGDTIEITSANGIDVIQDIENFIFSDISLNSSQLRILSNIPVQGSALINGQTREDATLTAGTSSLSDPDGLGTFSYQWLRDGTAIQNAINSTYTLTQADVGSAISVRVTYTDGEGTVESVVSAATSAIANVNDAPVGSALINGQTREDATLTAGTSSLSDPDGLGTFSYQWLRDGTAIQNAINSTYTLTQADVGSAISVRVSYTDGEGTAESIVSAATSAIANVNDAPVGSALINGQTREDATLTAGTSSLSDPDGLGTFSYQWLRDGTAIQNAINSTYTLTQADVGSAISVRVSYTDGEGTAESIVSAATSAIANVNDAPVGSALINGQTREDATLTAGTSSLSDPDGLGTFSYQWLRDGTAIQNAINSTYTLTQADVGSAISVRVSYTDGEGTAESIVSAATAAIANVNDAPVGSALINGQTREDATLTAGTSSLSDPDGLGTFSYQWLRDGTAIQNAINSTYTLTQADVGSAISVRVSYTDGEGTAESIVSAATAAITPNVTALDETGTEGPDGFTGTILDDKFDGLGGNDTASGGEGDDGLKGGDGDDSLDGGPGNDKLPGGNGNDIINGGPGNDRLGGGFGNDHMDGGFGNDGGGAGPGNDTIIGGEGNDRFNAGYGNDLINMGPGDDTSGGSFGNDTIFGEAGNDLLGGADGNDVIDGGSGDDIIISGLGDDTLTGGEGADQFLFNSLFGGGTTVITDFEDGIDTIRLVGLRNPPDPVGRLDITNITYEGQAAVEMTYGNHTVIVQNTQELDFTADDFLFN